MKLRVFQDHVFVGELFTSAAGVGFCYAASYCDGGNRPISLSLPLREEPFPEKVALPFFEGLLPEEEERRELSRILHVPAGSTMKLLNALAGECVGNLTLLDEHLGIDEVMAENGYSLLNARELESLLRPQSPARAQFIAAKRLSLAGAQAKIGLYRDEDGQWFGTQGLAPTTHIVKPASLFDPSILVNEFFVMRLASACGLAVPQTSVIRCGEYHGFVVERFDRTRLGGEIVRQGQEDFCQALSVMPVAKYEVDGGPGLKELFKTVATFSSSPLASLRQLLRVVLFNYLTGNCDAHAKNFSLLRDRQTGRLSLAPAYDLISTSFYGTTLLRSMAMSIGRHSTIDKIDEEDFSLFAEDAGIEYAAVTKEMASLRERMASALEELPQSLIDEEPDFAKHISQLREHLLRELQQRGQIV
jgi:serine/threonine-protein kinase HipA